MTTLALVPSPTEAALTRLEDLRQALDQPLDLQDAVTTARDAEVLRAWLRTSRMRGQAAAEAAELHLRALRKCGELLLERMLAASSPNVLPAGVLAELGLDSPLAHRMRLLARMPGNEFEDRLRAAHEAGRAPTIDGFHRAALRFSHPQRKRTTPTLTLLRRALKALREVRQLHTHAEYAAAREVARIGSNWSAQFRAERDRRDPRVVQRMISCILCGRQAPPRERPERCGHCGGAWFNC